MILRRLKAVLQCQDGFSVAIELLIVMVDGAQHRGMR